MFVSHILLRTITLQVRAPAHRTCIAIRSYSSSSDSSSDSDSDNEHKKKKMVDTMDDAKRENSNQESSKLEALLYTMMNKPKPAKTVDVAKQKKIKQANHGYNKPAKYDDQLTTAAKGVASVLGGDQTGTVIKLLEKLTTPSSATEEETRQQLSTMIQSMKKETQSKRENEYNNFQWKAKRDKLRKLSRNVQSSDTTEQPHKQRAYHKPYVGLWDGYCLGVFTKTKDEVRESPKLTTWEALEEQELKLLQVHPPQNIFDEMIQWTDQGILWKFPIDNEIGFDAEHNVHFSEHVFLERHLKDWCPKSGPIRHFMELVCVGLSKNPHMTVEEKRDTLQWYKDFFLEKEELLKDIGAMETASEQQIEPT